MNFIGLLRTLERVTRPPTRPTFSDTDDPLTDEMRAEGWEFTAVPEPPLTPDELVGVRGLLQERYEDPEARERNLYEELFLPDRACRPAQSRLIGGMGSDGKVVYPPESSASNPAGTGADPAPSPTIVQSAPPPTVDGGIGGGGELHSPGARLPHPDDAAAEWIGEAVYAIRNILAAHYFYLANHSSIGSAAHCICGYRPLGLDEWHEHVAPILAEALAAQPK